VFYKGEQVGERRHYDERLTMFMLRYRDPVRYGAWLDKMEARQHPDGAGIVPAHALNAVLDDAHGVPPSNESGSGGGELGRPLSEGPPKPEPEPEPADEYDGPEDLRDIWEKLRAASNAMAQAEGTQRAIPPRPTGAPPFPSAAPASAAFEAIPAGT
jgi:hypothetical protein